MTFVLFLVIYNADISHIYIYNNYIIIYSNNIII